MLTKMKKIFQNETVEKIFYFISIGLLVFFLGRIVLDVVDDQPFSWRNVIWSIFFFFNTLMYTKKHPIENVLISGQEKTNEKSKTR